MDTTISALRREAAAGDQAAEARLLVARLRAGDLTQEHLELAAWCGSEAARVALGWPPCPEPDHELIREALASGKRWATPATASEGPAAGTPVWLAVDLSGFVGGLSSWADLHPRAAGWVLTRAAAAAARVALSQARRGVSGPGGQSMEACAAREEAHATVRAAHRAITAAEAWLDDPTEARWAAWHVAYVDAGHVAWLPPPGHDRSASSIDAAARLASRLGVRSGNASVRAAVCSTLVAWALA